MSSATPLHLALGCLAACCLAGGCRPGDAVQSTPAPRGAEPHVIRLPIEIRPIQANDADTDSAKATKSIPAQYQQVQAPPAAIGPRITEISAVNQPTGAAPIREPAPPEVTEPPLTPPMRSEFVPIAMPEPAAPPRTAALPELAPEPTFDRPDIAAPPNRSPITAAADGPQLTSPSGPVGQASRPAPPSAQAFVPVESADGNKSFTSVAPTAPSLPPANAAFQQGTDMNVGPTQPTSDAGLEVAAQRALQMADHAAAMAQRGMLFSARTELIQALQFMAQSLDIQRGGVQHANALSAGLTALAEARDFSAGGARPGEAINVPTIASSHRTPLLQTVGGTPLSPVLAQQQYFAYAQSQLAAAAGHIPASSQILYRLGRLQTAMAAHDADPLALHAPQAIVFHQAALATDEKNWLAANELGVLFARYGQLPDARRLLVYSVTVHPHAEGWQNLAVVHSRLGETDLAQRAEHERQALVQQASKSPAEAAGMVRWVDTQTFAAAGGGDVHWPADTAAKTVAASASASTPRR